MTIRTLFIILLSGMFLFSGCKKYLDVQPEASYTENQIFKNESAIKQALNGLYIDLADYNLYGASLSTITAELLGQRYYTTFFNSPSSFTDIQSYSYEQPGVRQTFDDTWKKAYTTILAANIFAAKIDDAVANNVISSSHGQQLKGEAIAIRAMLHFDLLRLFGPVYSTAAVQPAIPYYTTADGKSQPLLNSSQVLEKVLSDFSTSVSLLNNDPVKQNGVVNTTDFYSGLRNQRLNYYAVKALMARVLLWGRKTQEAHAAAKEVLDQSEKWFPWLPYNDIVGNANPNRIFSPEVLFAVYNPAMYTNYTTYFSFASLSSSTLRAEPDRLAETFENNMNDYRYSYIWSVNGTRDPVSFLKYADLADQTKPWRFLQPLVRKSELYYILAETDPDPQAALGYLNKVRFNRGLGDLTTSSNLTVEIAKEYQKEFWGEGQLFFYYKRQNEMSVPSGNDFYSTITPEYVVPLPLSETTPR
ncbi:RagB/SusD family nutrient uptake outer membrane protein [Pedobacter sp. MC2016-14]|uniref:RagB/SusD family nutrient uptake outer membrane protein n=1 Tax=Pedobacter sp. MC2016-14 TaxID=2897327 RepID=UPI001E63E234|nr:RagB/SusD family nutrient uptake outer membrane protein [Pedobacter sp. MC2016-14]MCD0490531.1 RagB/SusD family nutrient uptake outer membrane protein [Pedobacter sp. MC2016-14]